LADIDIVVTDYFMPGETGLWLLERICERSQPVPVISRVATIGTLMNSAAGRSPGAA
jgi:CheY-like chemotaxis protein